MNKVFNINLGGYPFTIDEDAYQHLRTYLDAIHRHFKQTEGYEEITHDIETRLAELFMEQLGSHPIVSLAVVNGAINTMGRPEEFGAEAIEEEPFAEQASDNKKEGFRIKTGKRLFRDTDEKLIGGVAAGLAAYFGIPDPIWVRLFFVLIFISGGIGIPLYLILWAVMPEAKSASDRLAMRGEPINISNISKIINEELEHLTEKVSELGDELSGKKKSRKENKDEGSGFSQRFATLDDNLNDIGRTAREHMPDIKGILRTVLILVGVFFLAMFTLLWFAVIAGVSFATPLTTAFFPEHEAQTVLMMINVLIFIGIPLVAVILSIVRLVWKRRVSRGWKVTLGVVWLLNAVSLVGVGSDLGKEFVVENEVEQLLPFEAATDQVQLAYYQAEAYTSKHTYFGSTDVALPNVDVRYAIKKSDDQHWRLNQKVSARGRNATAARDLAWELELPLQLSEQQVAAPKYIPFDHLRKWRDQEVVLELMVPVGKSVQLDYDVWHKSAGIPLDHYPKTNAHVYTMSAEGKLICQDCTSETSSKKLHSTAVDASDINIEEEQMELEHFDAIRLQGFMKVRVEYAETYDVSIVGNDQEVQQLEKAVDNGLLSIRQNLAQTTAPIRLFIKTPHLNTLDIEATDDVVIEGFELEHLDLAASGDFELKLDIEVEALNIDAKEGVELEFIGEADHIDARLTEECRLDTDRGELETIELKLSAGSRAKLSEASDIIKQDVDASSSIRIVD